MYVYLHTHPLDLTIYIFQFGSESGDTAERRQQNNYDFTIGKHALRAEHGIVTFLLKGN